MIMWINLLILSSLTSEFIRITFLKRYEVTS